MRVVCGDRVEKQLKYIWRIIHEQRSKRYKEVSGF